MRLPKFLARNTVLKITSLNAVVISIRLVISVLIQRLLAIFLGEAGIANIGQIRNLMVMLTSTSTLGIFNGVVKYVSELKENKPELAKVFSTASALILVGSIISAIALFFWAQFFSEKLFHSLDYVYVFKVLAIIVPIVGINRAINGIVNGLSDYKRYAIIELIGYILASVTLVIGLYTWNLKGVLLAIAIAPVIQLLVLLFVFGRTLRNYITLSDLKLKIPYKKELLSFTLMSFVSTFLLNFIELDIRNLITNELNINEAGYWTALTFISKNYMVFATGLFTLYVIPKFANIHTSQEFTSEVLNIYKTILPIFGIGMLLVYVLKGIIVQFVYPDFNGMLPLFKWQLLGDFVRLGSLVLAHQFLAKRMVKSFIITEILSLALFFILSKLFLQTYGTEGVVIAHFVRYIIYFVVVIFAILFYFKKTEIKKG